MQRSRTNRTNRNSFLKARREKMKTISKGKNQWNCSESYSAFSEKILESKKKISYYLKARKYHKSCAFPQYNFLKLTTLTKY